MSIVRCCVGGVVTWIGLVGPGSARAQDHCEAWQAEALAEDFFVLIQEHYLPGEAGYEWVVECQTRLFNLREQGDFCFCEDDAFLVGSVYFDIVADPWYSAIYGFDFELSAEEAVAGGKAKSFWTDDLESDDAEPQRLQLYDTGVRYGTHFEWGPSVWRQWGHVFDGLPVGDYEITTLYSHKDHDARPYEIWDVNIRVHVVPHDVHLAQGSPGLPGAGTVVCPAHLTD